MYNISLNEGGHVWQKQNMVTIVKGNKNYDIMKCAICGIKGKTSSLSTIALSGSYSEKRVFNCAGGKEAIKVKITHCAAVGPAFENLTPGSIHHVIESPKGKSNDSGVWVMGVGEPVKILRNEYEII